jgi:phosphoribosylformylglycinamidine (FGAM) synthase PurS component
MINKDWLWIVGLWILYIAMPVYGSEFIIDTNAVFVPAPYDQKSCAIAFDGTNYLVVWEDGRSGGNPRIYAARVDQTGNLLDPNGIAITTTNSQSPAVAFDGTNYLIVWKDDRNGNYSDIYGARVSPSGTVLDPSGIAISTAASNQTSPAIAFDGINYLVVWEDYRNGNYGDIYGARITTQGSVLDPSGIAISTANDNQRYPAITFGGANYLVVWQDYRYGTWYGWDIYGARVNTSGVVLDINGIAISSSDNYQWYPALTFDGTNYFVVWGDRRGGLPEKIYGGRVSQSGTVLDPDGIPISTVATNGQYFPSVAFDNTNYLVVWDDFRSTTHNIMGARVTTAGAVLDPNGRYISNAARDQLYPVITFGTTNYFVVWDDYRSNIDFDVYGARVDQSASVLDPNGILVTPVINYQLNPAVAFDGTNYLAVWEDARAISYYNICGARISQSGIVIDTNIISISTATNDQMSPKVAFDGTNYLVVWADKRNNAWDIYGTRISQSGSVLEPNGIALSTATNYQEAPAIAFDGTNYLVVWEDKRGGTYYDIYGTRVNQSGTVLNPGGIAISSATNNQTSPAIAFDGTNYLVVWEDYRNGNFDIYCTRVNQSGSVLNPNGIAVSTNTADQLSPAVVFGGSNYLVVWVDDRNGSWDIYGARITPAGTVLDTNGIPICTNVFTQTSPAIAFDGTNYVIIWEDNRNGSWDIYGAAVDLNGTVVSNFSVCSHTNNEIDPALTIGPGCQILTVYSRFTDYINNKLVKTMRIWGTFYSLIGTEENSKVERTDPILLQNIPNPFENTTMIKYIIRDPESKVVLMVYDSQGRKVKTLVNDSKTAGEYFVQWDGKDENKNLLPEGLYFCTLKNGNYYGVKKMILLR